MTRRSVAAVLGIAALVALAWFGGCAAEVPTPRLAVSQLAEGQESVPAESVPAESVPAESVPAATVPTVPTDVTVVPPSVPRPEVVPGVVVERPAWLRPAVGADDEIEPGQISFEDAEGITHVIVTGAPHGTLQQARDDLEADITQVTEDRIRRRTRSERLAFWFPMDAADVRRTLLAAEGEAYVRGDYVQGRQQVVGHALLRFDDRFDSRLRTLRVASRSMQIVAAGCVSMALLAVAFAFLRMDRATRGLYTVRLQSWSVAAGFAILGVAGIAAWWIPWI